MSSAKLKKITVLIPCHNEESGIAHVIADIPNTRLKQLGFTTEAIVIDNNSTDRTAEVARAAGARVIEEPRKGKGNAMRTGFSAVSPDTEYVIMLDGDHTYKPYEIPRLVEPLISGFCDVVVGSRLGGKMNKGAFCFENRVVNWGFTFLVRLIYRANVTDVLSGFFAWDKEVVDELNHHLVSEGFSIEMEMITKTEKLGFEAYSVPITYDVRKGETKINAVRDGIIILSVLIRNLFWHPDAPVSSRRVKRVAID